MLPGKERNAPTTLFFRMGIGFHGLSGPVPRGADRPGWFNIAVCLASQIGAADEAKPSFERFADFGFDLANRQGFVDFVSWIIVDDSPCLARHEGLRYVEAIAAAQLWADENGLVIRLLICLDLEKR